MIAGAGAYAPDLPETPGNLPRKQIIPRTVKAHCGTPQCALFLTSVSLYPQIAAGFASRNSVTFLKTVRQSRALAKISST